MNDRDNQVVVTDVRMPFMSMVTFMVKASIAAIPATIIIFIIIGVLNALFLGVFTSSLS